MNQTQHSMRDELEHTNGKLGAMGWLMYCQWTMAMSPPDAEKMAARIDHALAQLEIAPEMLTPSELAGAQMVLGRVRDAVRADLDLHAAEVQEERSPMSPMKSDEKTQWYREVSGWIQAFASLVKFIPRGG